MVGFENDPPVGYTTGCSVGSGAPGIDDYPGKPVRGAVERRCPRVHGLHDVARTLVGECQVIYGRGGGDTARVRRGGRAGGYLLGSTERLSVQEELHGAARYQAGPAVGQDAGMGVHGRLLNCTGVSPVSGWPAGVLAATATVVGADDANEYVGE